MTETKFDFSNATLGGGVAARDYYDQDSQKVRDNSGTVVNKVRGDFVQNAPEQKQDLAEAAAEIQKLLEQLEKTYPTDSKVMLGAKAVEEIKNNPNLGQRIFKTIKAGSAAALDSFLDHPAASFAIAALEEWQESETNSL